MGAVTVGTSDDVPVVADAHLGFPRPVDALDLLQEAVHEMHPELLAIRDDVDAGRLLLLEPHQNCVMLRALQRGAFVPPRRPELLGLGQPCRFRQAAGDGGLQHDTHTLSLSRSGIMLLALAQGKPPRTASGSRDAVRGVQARRLAES